MLHPSATNADRHVRALVEQGSGGESVCRVYPGFADAPKRSNSLYCVVYVSSQDHDFGGASRGSAAYERTANATYIADWYGSDAFDTGRRFSMWAVGQTGRDAAAARRVLLNRVLPVRNLTEEVDGEYRGRAQAFIMVSYAERLDESYVTAGKFEVGLEYEGQSERITVPDGG